MHTRAFDADEKAKVPGGPPRVGSVTVGAFAIFVETLQAHELAEVLLLVRLRELAGSGGAEGGIDSRCDALVELSLGSWRTRLYLDTVAAIQHTPILPMLFQVA